MNRTKQLGFVLGPLLFVLILFFFKPEGLSPQARAVLASTAWIAIWWITEAIPIAVTALMPIVLFPLSGGLDLGTTTSAFGTFFEEYNCVIYKPKFICLSLDLHLMTTISFDDSLDIPKQNF